MDLSEIRWLTLFFSLLSSFLVLVLLLFLLSTNYPGQQGNTMLHLAAKSMDHPECIRKILSQICPQVAAKCDLVDCVNTQQNTALHVAVENDLDDAVQV